MEKAARHICDPFHPFRGSGRSHGKYWCNAGIFRMLHHQIGLFHRHIDDQDPIYTGLFCFPIEASWPA